MHSFLCNSAQFFVQKGANICFRSVDQNFGKGSRSPVYSDPDDRNSHFIPDNCGVLPRTRKKNKFPTILIRYKKMLDNAHKNS